eukprot:jgi/Chrpa1/13988/Chrysochromulina_OHIO_Genome00013292-RA
MCTQFGCAIFFIVAISSFTESSAELALPVRCRLSADLRSTLIAYVSPSFLPRKTSPNAPFPSDCLTS